MHAMDQEIRDRFISLWHKFFPGAELPITCFYRSSADNCKIPATPNQHRCLICDLYKVRAGTSLAFYKENIGCGGGRRYTGYSQEVSPNFSYFLSYGIPGEMEGERYKRDPEIVNHLVKHVPSFNAENYYLIFKRWDQLTEDDHPELVIFFAPPDVLSGLFTLANYDYADPNGVITPMCAGCASIVMYPYQEKNKNHPKSIIGLFDPSARACVSPELLTFTTPYHRLLQLIHYMEESFLINDLWKHISKRNN